MKRKTSIILLTYNNFHYTKDCIESIRRYTEKDSYEIIVVDNASTDETKDWLKEQEDIKMLLKQENVGFPKGCNLGISPEFCSCLIKKVCFFLKISFF